MSPGGVLYSETQSLGIWNTGTSVEGLCVLVWVVNHWAN